MPAICVLALLAMCAVPFSACDGDSDRPERCVPGIIEQCGGGDEDCDGLTDEPDANGCRAFGQDHDGDGQPDGEAERCLCTATPPWTIDLGETPCGSCDDGNPCTDDTCETASTTCQHTAREGTCEDIDPCTVDTFCKDGVCQGGGELDCNDGNPCTGDLCHAGIGCAFVALFTACDDNDRCTERDQCSDGRCVGTPLVDCGEPYCGDGECASDESCADCEADCSPLGFGHCGATCDPLGSACGADAVCVPTELGGVCLSEFTRCDATDGSGCPAGEGCAFVAGPDFGGSAALCQPIVEALRVGDACRRDLAPCADGAICWRGTCTATCDPAEPRCALGGACDAVGDAFGRAVSDLGICAPACGNERCEGNENCVSCPGDCGACVVECGDGRCIGDGESCESCPEDCGACPSCGDGDCSFGREDCASCADDCGACACGDGTCTAGETCAECRADCGDCPCGDGTCAASETCQTCQADCGPCSCAAGGPCEPAPACGDGRCTPDEDCTTCGLDCGGCACGDGQCNGFEDCLSCASDCGACRCGDGACQPPEDCRDCESDCGACRGECGDGRCQDNESCQDCAADCGACQVVCGDGLCVAGSEDCSTCRGDCPTCPPVCGDGVCAMPGETCLTCPADCDFAGLGTCDGACDPLAPACAPNYMCMPIEGDLTVPRTLGDGFCARDCSSNAGCGGETCADLMEGDRLCVQGETCDPETRDGCARYEHCVPSAAAPWIGFCARECSTSASVDACGEGNRCLKGHGAVWSRGVCVGQDTPCNPGTQAGCDANESCAIIGLAAGKAVTACTRRVGTATLGQQCGNVDELALLCEPGLVCDDEDLLCRTPCVPGTTTCAFGECVDLAAKFAPGIMGGCR